MDTPNLDTKMIKIEECEKIRVILGEYIDHNPRSRWYSFRNTNLYDIISLISFFFIIILLFSIFHFEIDTQDEAKNAQIYEMIFYILTISCVVSQLISICIELVKLRSYSKVFAHDDNFYMKIDIIQKLTAVDKGALEYCLWIYRLRLDRSDKKISLAIGDFPKIGLLPALLGTAVAGNSILKQDASIFLWALVLFIICVYIGTCYVFRGRDRPATAIALLEYAIRLTDKAKTNSSGPKATNEI